ncbi:MAG: hypothetical protein N2321_12045 [Melioribacteraceae bacterium]|nr:hypothetical protein [Melioribacteraceae bacterium]
MKVLKVFLLIIFVSSLNLFAQFSLETFLNEPFDQTTTSIKEKIVDKKIEEKEIMNYKALLYYDWVDPISLKVGYMFTKEGKQNGKVVSNGKENEEDAQKLFDISKATLINKYGNKYSENSMMGVTMLMWKGIERYTVMLSRKGDKTMLTVISK